MSGVRSTARWQGLCKRLIPRATHCALCQGLLDHDAAPRSRFSPSLDHIVPISRGGSPFDPANLQVTHYGCNARKGNRTGRRAAAVETVRLPVCDGRACVCAWGEFPEEKCRKLATRKWITVEVPPRA